MYFFFTEALLEFLKNANFINNVKKPVAKGRFKGLDVEKFLHQVRIIIIKIKFSFFF